MASERDQGKSSTSPVPPDVNTSQQTRFSRGVQKRLAENLNI